MPIYKDSYQTTIGSAFNMKPVENAIKESFLMSGINNVSLNVKTDHAIKPVFILGSTDAESNIPLFTHPFLVSFKQETYLCTDLRLHVRKDVNADNVENSVKNLSEFNFCKSRGILNLIWVNDGINQIKNGLSFSSSVFTAWISDSIARAYALDYNDQTILAIITNFYYQTLFMSDYELNEDTKQLMASHTIKITKAPSNLVFQVFDKLPKIKDINDYCDAVKDITGNIRLKDFNLAMLLTIIKNSWHGQNAKEIISVSLEHPPTWCAVVYAALNERTFSSSAIYRYADKLGKRGASEEFLKSYVSMVKDVIIAKEDASIIINQFE